MIELGKIQRLKVIRMTKVGAFLNTEHGRSEDDILLPMNQVPRELDLEDEIEVFVYKDSEDRMIATTKKPKITIGELAKLQVVDNARIGAFLDWGLDKDLLLPFKEQTYRVTKNEMYLVGLYIDKSRRLCATMDISRLLSDESPYKENDRIHGTIYKINEDFGAFVAVNNKYNGLIPNKELYGEYRCGDSVEVRIKKVRDDGKLELSLRKEAYNEIDDDAKKIMDRLIRKGGKLKLNDNSQPADIKSELNMSKSAFKRAVGRLLKERKIRITEKGIEEILNRTTVQNKK
ncbi:MAG TPA: S1-like domain-containing RNA-binding protein [Patescibacteria group bacterium]|nr:S1-like domain-containing RNA-binding protein [Patescibacteria group bacterium]